MSKHTICCPQCDQITRVDENLLKIWCGFCQEFIFFKENQKLKLLCNCGKSMLLSFYMQGKNVRCPGCKETVSVPIVPLQRDKKAIIADVAGYKEQKKIKIGLHSQIVLLVEDENIAEVKQVSEKGIKPFLSEPLSSFDAKYQQLPLFSFHSTVDTNTSSANLFRPRKFQNQWWVPIQDRASTMFSAVDSPEELVHSEKVHRYLDAAQHNMLIGLSKEVVESVNSFWKNEEDQTTEVEDISVTRLVQALPIKDIEPEPEPDIVDNEVENNTIVKLANQIIITAFREGASDLHIEVVGDEQELESQIRFRIDGICQVYRKLPISAHNPLVSRLKIMADLDISKHRIPQYGKIHFRKFAKENIRIRVTTMPTASGYEEAILRILPSNSAISLNQIDMLPETLEKYKANIQVKHGLVLVAGPTGSGKTTTMHSSLRHLKNDNIKIITIEDPVEITQKGMTQIQINTKMDLTFANILRGCLRSDPDIIMVGEIRDNETAVIATQASLTGHLVFSTLHTNSAPETSIRMLHLGVDPYNLADSLKVIVAQRLARRLCRKCRMVDPNREKILQHLEKEYAAESNENVKLSYNAREITFYKAVGCDMCQNGYKGRIGIHELLVNSKSIQNLIRDKSDSNKIRQVAMKEGMKTLKQDAIIKVFSGYTDMKQMSAVSHLGIK